MRKKLLEKDEIRFYEKLNYSKQSSKTQSILEISFSLENERIQSDDNRKVGNILDDLNDNNFHTKDSDSPKEKNIMNDSFEKYDID